MADSVSASAPALYLPEVEARHQPGTYADLVAAARASGVEYSKIWDLFAYQCETTRHLGRFTHGVLRTPASVSPGLRELIAAYTSRLNACGFCTQSHARAAAELLGDEALVDAVLIDPDASALSDRDKALLRYVRRITLELPTVGADDITTLKAAGWDDEAIYFAATTCALFNFYNRWITSMGVPEMSAQAHRIQGRSLAARGYTRD
jgi:uncharacterized peroxidase-related enzyme